MDIDTSQIARMSREEKLLMMEALWADLSRAESEVESPDWHQAAPNETDDRLTAGEETVLDWDEAKRELRKRLD